MLSLEGSLVNWRTAARRLRFGHSEGRRAYAGALDCFADSHAKAAERSSKLAHSSAPHRRARFAWVREHTVREREKSDLVGRTIFLVAYCVDRVAITHLEGVLEGIINGVLKFNGGAL